MISHLSILRFYSHDPNTSSRCLPLRHPSVVMAFLSCVLSPTPQSREPSSCWSAVCCWNWVKTGQFLFHIVIIPQHLWETVTPNTAPFISVYRVTPSQVRDFLFCHLSAVYSERWWPVWILICRQVLWQREICDCWAVGWAVLAQAEHTALLSKQIYRYCRVLHLGLQVYLAFSRDCREKEESFQTDQSLLSPSGSEGVPRFKKSASFSSKFLESSGRD